MKILYFALCIREGVLGVAQEKNADFQKAGELSEFPSKYQHLPGKNFSSYPFSHDGVAFPLRFAPKWEHFVRRSITLISSGICLQIVVCYFPVS